MILRIALAGLMVMSATAARAQSNPAFIQLPGLAKAALYTPDSGPAAHVAVIVTHRTNNQMSGLPMTEFPKRGIMVLGLNSRFENNEASVEWEDIALDVKSAVEFLRKQPGITKVILHGGSGGGPTMSFYQAVAEKGPSYCQGPGKLMQCTDKLANLPRADGVIFRDAHPGNSVNGVRSLNASLMDETDPTKIDPSLDPYSAKNGYNPNGSSNYSDDFKQRYFKAQAARMNRLIAAAEKRLALVKAGKRTYTDDEPFIVPRAVGARLMEMDMRVHHATVKPQKLLKNDGTIVTQIVESVRQPNLNMKKSNFTLNGGTLFLTLKSFLSANAIRSTDSMDGIDWCSSNNSTPCALRSISVPVLIFGMGGHYFVRDNEINYEAAASKDKDYVIIDGATHGITPCTECESTPGQYGNSVKNFFDYAAKWINERY
ncbi:MAG: hypothetical protein EXQ56_08730 [Acidobacteria bacterium]|nr:hypothetical protein [Acidobacteriota bacterium]